MKDNNSLPVETKIAICSCCLLADAMKDCKSCAFKIGLDTKKNPQNVQKIGK